MWKYSVRLSIRKKRVVILLESICMIVYIIVLENHTLKIIISSSEAHRKFNVVRHLKAYIHNHSTRSILSPKCNFSGKNCKPSYNFYGPKLQTLHSAIFCGPKLQTRAIFCGPKLQTLLSAIFLAKIENF